jgi:ribosomal protein L21
MVLSKYQTPTVERVTTEASKLASVTDVLMVRGKAEYALDAVTVSGEAIC